MFSRLKDELSLTYIFIAHDLLVVRYISDRIAVMYLGKIVELAASNELFDAPLHPYTKMLLSAVPIPDPREARKRTQALYRTEIPSPLEVLLGCPFHTRCPYAEEICKSIAPIFREIGNEHFVACHRIEEIN